MAGKTKNDLVNETARKAEMTKGKTKMVLDTLLESIEEELQSGRKVTLSPLGNFSVTQRKARRGRNPSTGETIQIPAQKNVKFTPSKNIKDQFN
ncbi:MAG: HU family DNA-binding protein [Desulfohalobiaceae bacterium]|nr:HU family DNA-binding protein [Desulfohalobiaceae bacterium]